MVEEIKETPKPISLTITLEVNGQVKVSGPLQNKLLCYGLLETAKEVLARPLENKVVEPARHGIFNFARRKR